jgi:hypothetical protein
MKEYKYLSFEKEKRVDVIMKAVSEMQKDGWEIVSHTQSEYGMSVILEREVK